MALTKQRGDQDLQGMASQIRLNGLPKIDPTGTFDPLIAHPRVLPFLKAWVGGGYGVRGPQLVNIWSITKAKGSPGGTYHSGLGPGGFSVDSERQINSQMLNVVWMLSDNGIADGCMSVMCGASTPPLPPHVKPSRVMFHVTTRPAYIMHGR